MLSASLEDDEIEMESGPNEVSVCPTPTPSEFAQTKTDAKKKEEPK
jgi:hypothetical protein